jgi:hypothetical protein
MHSSDEDVSDIASSAGATDHHNISGRPEVLIIISMLGCHPGIEVRKDLLACDDSDMNCWHQ